LLRNRCRNTNFLSPMDESIDVMCKVLLPPTNQTGATMIIRGIMVVAVLLASYQTFAQSLDGSAPVVPENIRQLREALKAGQPTRPIEIPARLAKTWLQMKDSDAWTAIQQQKQVAIDLKPLFLGQKLPRERVFDGIDPFATYDKDGNLKSILIRGMGIDPSIFAESVIESARKEGNNTTVLTATYGDKRRSSTTQELIAVAEDAANTVCSMGVKPKQVSVSVSGGVSFIFQAGAVVEAVFQTEELCEWLSE